jgi:pimeloyl-ACP methyl ester carboxylesterase
MWQRASLSDQAPETKHSLKNDALECGDCFIGSIGMQISLTARHRPSLLARVRRLVSIGLATIVGAIALALAWYSVTASLRETVPPGRDGYAGSYVEAGGIDIHYTSWGPATGEPILLIHGTLAWSQTWYQIAERLADQGFHVIAPDLPPFGFSQRPADGDYSRHAQGKLILSFAVALGLKDVVLVGHSFGGGATMEAAFAAPDRIKGLVLLDVALGLDAAGGTSMLARAFGTPFLGRTLTAASFTNPLMTGKGLRDFIYDDRIVDLKRIALYQKPFVVRDTSREVAKWLAGALFNDETASLAADRRNYERFPRPVVLIWGRQDSVTPLAQGEQIRALLPRSTLVVLDRVNHIPHVEQPEKVAGIIAEFAGTLGDASALLPQAIIRRTF